MPGILTETVINNGPAAVFSEAPEFDGEPGNAPIDTSGIDGYFIHKIGTQLLSGSTLSVSNAFRVAAEYSVYTSRYLTNPGDPIFNGSGRFIYQTDTLGGRAFKSVLLPGGYRTNDLTPGQIKKLSEDYYARMSKYQLILLRASNAINVAGNLGAIYYCMGGDKDCSAREYTTFASYAAADGAFYVGGHFQYNGSQLVGSDSQNAYRSFNLARKSFIVMNIVEIVGGSTKVGIEIYNSIAEPDKFSMSSLVDGGLRIGTGSSWLVYNGYMAREAAKLAGNPATIGKAIDILRAHAIVLPPKILWAIRGTGAIGPLISAGVSVSDIYGGVTDDSLPPEKSTHKIVSGSLGIVSSLCFLGFAFFVTPASIPIGVVFFSAGLGLLAIQTTYDEWDDMKALYDSKMAVEVKKWPKMM